MMHLDPEQLYSSVFDRAPLGGEDEQHLATCPACRQALADLSELAIELATARASQPSLVALDHYYELFTQVRPAPARGLAFWRSLTAMLAWDSRQQPSLQGVRSGGAGNAFRLLYATEQAEVEILVEPEGHLFRTQGEIVTLDDLAMTPALIQWFDAGGSVRYETESDPSGLFSLRNIAPGTYRLSIVSAASDIIEIEALEIM
jgi:hypothetical protein